MSMQYYADTGYGIKDIILKPEESITFEEIKKLITMLKNKKVASRYTNLTYKEFFDTQNLEYETSQLIWELLTDIIYQDTGLELEFVSDDDYNKYGKCMIFRNNAPWFKSNLKLKSQREAAKIFEKYVPLITKKKFIADYIYAIQYG